MKNNIDFKVWNNEVSKKNFEKLNDYSFNFLVDYEKNYCSILGYNLIMEVKYIGSSKMTTGNLYEIYLLHNKTYKSIKFLYNDNYINICDPLNILYCLLSDANAYEETKNFYDFVCMFGYNENANKLEEGKKAFEGCKENYKKLNKLLKKEEQEKLQKFICDMGY